VHVLVVQHIACEPPGVYEDVLRDRAATIERVELDDGDPLPDWRGFDAVVAMGGPMGAADDGDLPWLANERRFIREAVRAGTPFWGVCLGAQLLAASLGGKVYSGRTPEVGLLPVTLTREALDDPVFAQVPQTLLTLQWHGDTFDLPLGAELLATSPAYAHQAFRWGRAAYGLQFHLEVSAEMAREWAAIQAYAEALERVLGPGSAETMIEELERQGGKLRAHGRRLFERWLDIVPEGSSATSRRAAVTSPPPP
jgi:GMP synthase (glutamine-hydrolysing)